MLELLIVPVCFVIFVSYLMCSLYNEQQKYYRYYHPTEEDMNEHNETDSDVEDEKANEKLEDDEEDVSTIMNREPEETIEDPDE